MTDQPETLRQARRWDQVKAGYLKRGLCSPCAAQLAWGQQLGPSHAAPPCRECSALLFCPS
jgi:hypothetical protein